MSRNHNPLILSISKKRLETQIASNNDKIASEKQSQTIITRSFNARRNSGQIERYFIDTQSTCCIYIIIIISTLITFGIFASLLFIPRTIIKKKIERMTEEIVILTQDEIMLLISTDLNLSFFYSILLSSMMYPPAMITPDLYSARDIVKVFAKTYRTNQNNKIWRLGLSSGRFIGFSAEDGIKLFYSRTNVNDVYPLFIWEGNPITYDNSSYPYLFYDQGDPYISYETQWYILAEKERKTCWTPLSTGINPNKKLSPLISTASPVFDTETNEVFEVFSIGVHIEQIQFFFNNFLNSSSSRFALLNSFDTKGTIIACTGQDIPYEEINGMLSFKTLLELQDDVWRQIVSNEKFEKEENFTFHYGSEIIHFIFAPFEMAPGINWCFISVFSVNDIVNADIPIVDLWSFAAIFIFVAVCILIIIIIIILNKAVLLRQSKILKNKVKKNKEGHIKYVGINPSIVLLQKVLLSHADNPDINNNVEMVVKDLINSTKYTYFNSKKLIHEIENKKVKQKFVKIFGPLESGLIKNLPKPSKNDLEIVNYYNEKKEPKMPNTPRLNKANNSIEKKLEKVIISRHNMTFLKKEKMIKRVIFFVQSFNLENPLFDPDQLDIIIQKIIISIGEPTLPLLYDSIEFVFILMKRNAQSLIPDTDYTLAIFFSLFSYHMSMVNRHSANLELIDKFFQRKRSRISHDAHSILFGLYKILIDTEKVRIERWEKFKKIVFSLITKGAILSQHRHSFEKSRPILNIAEKKHSKITVSEANSIVFSIFCGAQLSFFFHRREDCHHLIKIFIPQIEFSPRPIILSKFMSCLMMQYIQPLSSTLGSLCGKDFIEWIRSSNDLINPPKNIKIFV